MTLSNDAVPPDADADAKEVLILMNPSAGVRSGRPRVEALHDLLRERGLAPSVVTDPLELAERSRAALTEGRLRAVVAAGGDGTAALAINQTPIGAPIAVLPLGTENLLAKYVKMREPADVCRAIERAVTVNLDVGQANGRLFLLMLSCGFDADVVHRLHAGRRGNIRHLSYAKPIFHSLRTYDYPEIRVTPLAEESVEETVEEVAGKEAGEPVPESLTARWVFVMNLPCYALGIPIAPDATGLDGLLDVCTFRGGSWWNGLRYLGGIMRGRHRQDRDCSAFRVPRLRIEADKPTPLQIDGDPGGMLPVEVGLLPGRLKMLMPEK